MGKRLSAIFLGLLAAIAVILIIQSINSTMYPLPLGINPEDTEAIMKAYANLPTEALLIVLLSYALGSFAGGLTAALISKPGKIINAVIVGIILLIMGLVNLASITHPFWFWVAAIIIFIPFTVFGAKIRR